MAEILFRERFEGIAVRSAGISAIEGQPMSMNAQKAVFNELNIFADMHAKQVTHDMLKEADVIITMTSHQKRIIKSEGYENVWTLKEMAGEEGSISDPYGMGYDRYLETFNEIKDAINKIDLKKFKGL